MPSVTTDDINRLRDSVSHRLGLVFDDSHTDLLAEVLRRRIRSTGSPDAGGYLRRLALSGEEGEWGELANELVVGETYFFRCPDHLAAFTEVALPQRLRERDGDRPLSILSAGCTSGEEPYSLAILACEALGQTPAADIQVTGIDISPAMIDRAVRARYSDWSLRATSAQRRQRYFRAEGRESVLNEAIRSMAQFQVANILDDDGGFWRAEAFDIIFFRNVAIYFSRETTSSVIARLARSLAPGGFLFLGPSETLRGLSNDFHLLHTHQTFYYQRRRDGETHPLPIKSTAVTAVPAVVAVVADERQPQDQSWAKEIQRAAGRISAIADQQRSATTAAGSTASATSGTPPPARAGGGHLAPAHELLRLERFDDALAALRQLPAASAENVDALLLRAAISTNKGNVQEAEDICRKVLELDELNAGAHYLFALCREYADDRAGAAEHDQTSIYLDPAFAMPHFHLGMMTKRGGDLTTAQRELQQALALLEREDAARILLFGGGFSREALIQLCRAEWRAAGGVP